MKITVIGSRGQLGQDLCARLIEEGHQVSGLTHQQISIEEASSVASALSETAPDLVINTAAYNKVDQAESEPEVAYAINALGPRNLARYCQEQQMALMQISSDYVFGLDLTRQAGYREQDAPGPVSAYGLSKLAGEYFVRALCAQHYVIRTCGLYGKAGKTGNGNFVETMLRLGRERDSLSIINDQHCTPTSTRDLAEALTRLISTDQFGLYHVTNRGQTTWYELARKVFEIAGIEVETSPITTEQYNAAADRPRYSVLDCSLLEEVTQYTLPDWQTALENYLQS
ncbi:dTDP-4-dehydrorhamnose reductase [Gimesia panareensis]|uniref:dTDP-4-dehydrorhamnose reductase n=1 Tax=Gimesia panareensis TaxID=2527978 RepID=UPI00118CDFC2|nr:dTDP-4-dehydrorhamnose reductase [Gimesia panareensis]QDU52841.1 dTDP-4-dehydrorhamnose reductase [Gimesia panareensis]